MLRNVEESPLPRRSLDLSHPYKQYCPPPTQAHKRRQQLDQPPRAPRAVDWREPYIHSGVFCFGGFGAPLRKTDMLANLPVRAVRRCAELALHTPPPAKPPRKAKPTCLYAPTTRLRSTSSTRGQKSYRRWVMPSRYCQLPNPGHLSFPPDRGQESNPWAVPRVLRGRLCPLLTASKPNQPFNA